VVEPVSSELQAIAVVSERAKPKLKREKVMMPKA